MLEVVEEFILNSDDAPDCPSDCLNHHADEDENLYVFHHDRMMLLAHNNRIDKPPETTNKVQKH